MAYILYMLIIAFITLYMLPPEQRLLGWLVWAAVLALKAAIDDAVTYIGRK